MTLECRIDLLESEILARKYQLGYRQILCPLST